MRLFAFALTSTLLAGSALAAEPVTKQSAVRNDTTVEEINKAREWMGRPPLGSSRLLHEDNAQINRLDTVSKITIERR